MAVEDINHVNIAAPQPLMKQVRDFYVDVIGLEDGPRPGVGIPGHWLYGGGKPLVHLMEPMGDRTAGTGSGAIDHLALTCSDLPAMEARIGRAGVPYRKNEMRDFGIAQLFVTDPAGLKVELNFQL